MATSEHTDQVEIATSQGQQKRLSISEILGTFCRKFCNYLLYFNSELDLDLLSFSVNVSPPKDRVRTTSSSERSLKVATEIVNDNTQGTTTVSQPMPNIQGTEATTSERSLTPGMQLESSAVSMSEHDLPCELPPHGNVSIQEDTGSHQPTPPESTEEPHGIANILSSAVFTGTSKQSSRKGLLKGNTWFRFPDLLP
jgi:hypothetical protein